MKTVYIAIIEDNPDDFFRLSEQIRLHAKFVDKIYACSYESEFYQLPNWQDCNLIIADNEIKGRSDAGLTFFDNLYKEHGRHNIFGFLYTWGTEDYNTFRIRVCPQITWTFNWIVLYSYSNG